MSCKLYKARYPLEGGPSQLRLHVAIIVKDDTNDMVRRPGDLSDEQRGQQLVLFDFLPKEPTALGTAVQLFLGGAVDGNLRRRTIRFLPRGATFVGQTDATMEEMEQFVSTYPNRLSFIRNDCGTFVDMFVMRFSGGSALS